MGVFGYQAQHWNSGSERTRFARIAIALITVLALIVPLTAFTAPARAAERLPWEELSTGGGSSIAAVGQGFNLNIADLEFILEQIKISEQHAATLSASDPCGTLIGPGPDQIPEGPNAELQMLGLRTIDGSCNNLLPGEERAGASDEVFSRMAPTDFRSADTATFDWDGPGPLEFGDSTSYTQTTGVIEDAQPRIASNLIVDQTISNPAATAAAQGADTETAFNGNTQNVIDNVAPDEGLSAPFNSWFVFFGQFFDHGLDITTKSGSPVFLPLQPDDPLWTSSGPNFMVVSRATNPDGDPINQTTPWVDQQQTYASTPSAHIFLREYIADPLNPTGAVATGNMLSTAGGLATWENVKSQTATLLGIQLTDDDLLSVPLLASDPYGNFIPGANGYPQIVSPGAPGGLLEGDPTANGGQGVLIPVDAVPTGHPFLFDIAHHAVPNGNPDADSDVCRSDDPCIQDYQSGGAKDGQFDDEMINAHFICGDGRCNENIGLSSVHHVFHSEHNRLNDQIKGLLLGADPAFLAEWELAAGVWNGERLLQAARFGTEMQYQHLVFEEFARKVAPAVNVFGSYDPTIDPAITAEFSQAVYRYGHSQLTETIKRYNDTAPGAPLNSNDIDLFDAFLNPPAFFDGGSFGTLTADAAAGSVVRGTVTQVGQEIDEFVVEALRNGLVGLPLDLPATNMTRGRDFGLPRLQNARRAFFAQSGDASLTPYSSWSHFGLNLKHAESLVNFIAAYGTHQTILDATTNADRRVAAQAIIDAANLAGPGPADSLEFMSSTGAWASSGGGVTSTGLNNVDLWVGGLAEKRESFGGMLGSTFNYVFELQLEALQDGDRFYYLGRLGGMNMLVQIEGNSFGELIERNSDALNLPADVFSVPTFFFDAGFQGSVPGTPIVDDPATAAYDETLLLTRDPDGTIRYPGIEHVNWGGGPGADMIYSGGGDDTLKGNDGPDRLEGAGANDVIIGGNGNDIITDVFGDDNLKGGDGNDAIHTGPGLDLSQGGRGHDFSVGGSDDNVHISGEGNDFVFGGDGADEAHGDDGDDWLQGGPGDDNMEGDSGLVILTGADVNTPGHDVIRGDGGDDRLFGEGGDDVLGAGIGVDRFFGQLGFDWITHYGDAQPGDSDMLFDAFAPPGALVTVDAFAGIEGMSGWDLDDNLHGDDLLAIDQVDNELDAEGVARIDGLSALLGGATSFTGGNIIIGGAGSDMMEGRGGDDRIDGDAWLSAQLLAPVPAGGTQLVDSVLDLQADVFAGLIDPGDISIVRTINPGVIGTDVDTVIFSGPIADYDIQDVTSPYTVTHARNNVLVDDGTDTLTNVEFLQFTDATVPIGPGPDPGPGPDTAAPTWWGFYSTDAPKALPDVATTTSTVDVAGIGTITDLNVSLSLTHTWDEDLDVFLISPATTRVELFTDVGGSGDDFTGTTLDDEAVTPIIAAAAPFSGSFSPEGALSAFDGEDPTGTWTLEITDDTALDTGELLSWSLDFEGGAVTVSNETNNTVELTWSGASDDVGVVDYNVYQDTVLVQTGVAGDSTTVTGLDPDTTYTFEVQARDAVPNESVDGPSVAGTTTSAASFAFSTLGSTNAVPGVAGTPDDADVYSWSGSAFSRTLDGSVAGLLDAADIDGLTVVAPDHFFASFNMAATDVPTVGTVQGEDIVEYDAGTWSLFFDGTAEGLTTALGVDAIDVVGSNVYFSTSGITSVPGVGGTADDADIYLWNGSSFSRVWDATIDGGMELDADLDGLTVVTSDHFYLSFKGDITVPIVAEDEDIVEYNASVWSPFFDGTSEGLTATDLDLDAIQVGSGAPVDAAPPTVAVTGPVNWSTVGAPVLVEGTASDDVAVTSVKLEIYDRDTTMWWNGAAFQAGRTSFDAVLAGGGTSWSYSFTPLAAATEPYWVTVRSFDAVANPSGFVYTNFTVATSDVTAPSVSVNGPVNWSTVGAPVPIGGTASDDVAVTSVKLEIYDRDTTMWWNGAAFQAGRTSFDAVLAGGGTSWSYNFTPLAAATEPYWVTVRSFDAAANASAYGYVNFTVTAGDVTAPSVSVTGPVNWSTVAAPVLIGGTSSDDTAVTSVKLEIYDRDTTMWWNGAAFQAGRTSFDAVLAGGGTSWSYSFTPLAAATEPYWVTVRSFDAATNSSDFSYVNFTVGSP